MRVKNLDGLRGLAALVVVMHHSLLTIPWFSDRVGLRSFSQPGVFAGKNFHNLIEYSPLHIFYAGTEAVTIFFVLSGYVLVFAIKKTDIKNYLRFRLYRLYVPIFGAVCLSFLLLVAFTRKQTLGQSAWLQGHIIKPSLGSLIQNMWVLDGNTALDSSLWSMRYEIIFSMAVLIIVGVNFKIKHRIFFSIICFLISILLLGDHLNLDLLGYLPIFFAGSALHWLPENSRFAISRLLVGIVVLLTPWYFVGFGYEVSSFGQHFCMTIGSLFIVDICRVRNSDLSKVLSWRPISAVGRYSYSLYLIHAPILVTVWFVLGQPHSWSRWVLNFTVSIICISFGTALIYNAFERPVLKYIHKLS
jgi:peptidoglycan/LPS O-acetylase OafA/YrhL